MLKRFHSQPFAVRFAVVAWAILLVSVSLRVAIAPAWKGTVVNIYIAAAEHWLASENVYLMYPGLDLYRNPPGVTPLFVPLTLVPAKLAGILWRLASAAAFLLALRSWLRAVWPERSLKQTGAIYLLTLPLALASLNNGQINLLLVGLLMLGCAAVARSRFRSGSLWLAAAAGLKIYPAAVGMLLAAVYPRRMIPLFVAGIVAFAALPFLFQRTDYVLEMHRTLAWSLQHDVRSYDDPNRAPQDAFLLLHVCGIEPGKGTYHAVQLAAAAGMALLVLRASRRGSTPAEIAALAFHLGCIWMTTLGPASEGPTYTLLAPSAAMLLVANHAGRRERRLPFLLALLAYVLLISPIVRDAFPHGSAYRSLGALPAGGLVLLVAVLWAAFRRRLEEPALVFTQRISITSPTRLSEFSEAQWQASETSNKTPSPGVS